MSLPVSNIMADDRAGVPKPTTTTNSSVSREVPVRSGMVTDGASAGAATYGDGIWPMSGAGAMAMTSEEAKADRWSRVVRRALSWRRMLFWSPACWKSDPLLQAGWIASLFPDGATVDRLQAVKEDKCHQ